MPYLIIIFLFFVGCSNNEDKSLKSKSSDQEIVQIEQNDEKTQVNDDNLPLPVGDDSLDDTQVLNMNLSIISSLYKQKCANCHGKEGELKLKNNIRIKNLSKENFMRKFNLCQKQNDKDHCINLNLDQIENLAKYITNKGK
ncbi:cytochrome c [Campylobacter sp. TTU-622]|uniref:cytochrome c n=1 Tax=unclassified Campylobacter TaxID=2593542 RepID=UPI0019036322|nr:MULTISPECIES: cytochrome c [unclassified Campylobacter]MBK1971922.1 cytochrome c [Campylobacter sp. TTU_617]MBK1973875.1 cytochrome c [Campylobacter sp. TTU-622]MBK1991535.1 cytochrome c [Campylobacter sp. 2018MI34]